MPSDDRTQTSMSHANKETSVPRSIVVGLARELYDRFVMGGWEPQDSYELIEEILDPVHGASGWACGARRQGTAGGNDPPDCNWPICGCDPYASKVISALDEMGALKDAR